MISHFRGISRVWHAILSLVALLPLTSCSGFVYDDEGDCRVRYLVKFRYDYNMKFADAFRPEVDEVTLHLIDGNGNVVWSKSESGS
nr:FimB/Mfa2 family fimbrial subunit [Muribaculaceae bacterium]